MSWSSALGKPRTAGAVKDGRWVNPLVDDGHVLHSRLGCEGCPTALNPLYMFKPLSDPPSDRLASCTPRSDP